MKQGPIIDLDQIPLSELQRIYKSILHLRDKPKAYSPHPMQEKLHRSLSKEIVASAGNRGGKSDAGANETVWRVQGNHPFKRVRTPCKAWIGSYDFKNGIDGVVLPKIMGALDKRLIDDIHKTQGIIDKITLINGSVMEFKSYEQESTKWEGKDIDFLWLDEPPPKEHYIAARRGLVDRGGDILITATMVNDPWVSNELIEPALNGENPNVFVISWSSYDNPHINHEEVKRFELSLPPEDRPVRIYGKIREVVGKVLKRFQPTQPFIVPRYDWPANWPYFEGLDPHPASSKGHFWGRLGVTPRKDLVIFHAEVTHGDMPTLAKTILASRDQHHLQAPIIPTVADTSLNSYDPMVKKNLRDWLSIHGVNTTMAQKRNMIVPGYERMNQLLWNTEQNAPNGLYVMDHCDGIKKEWKSLIWDTRDNGKTQGDDDHTDWVRYITVMEPEQIIEKDYYASQQMMKADYAGDSHSKKNNDSRKYSNKAFDRDANEEDEESELPGFVLNKKNKGGWYG